MIDHVEKRIKIAEAIGWSQIENRNTIDAGGRSLYGYPPVPIIGKKEEVPYFLNDLNAMHEAENTLIGDAADWDVKPNPQLEYTRLLMRMTGQQRGKVWHECQYFSLHATAAQRAEAFGRTLGLWK